MERKEQTENLRNRLKKWCPTLSSIQCLTFECKFAVTVYVCHGNHSPEFVVVQHLTEAHHEIVDVFNRNNTVPIRVYEPAVKIFMSRFQ